MLLGGARVLDSPGLGMSAFLLAQRCKGLHFKMQRTWLLEDGNITVAALLPLGDDIITSLT